MEAVPRLPMLSFELKNSPEATSFGKLKRYIGESYHEDPETYTKEVYELESLRSASMRPTTDVTGCSILKRYYSQLHSLQGRFPSISERQILNFSWADVHSSMLSRSSEIKYEMAAILYNIGCLHTELGSIDSRTSPEGMKIACTHFQCAAWAFMHLRENFPQMLNNDLSPDLLIFMEQLSFAQAQECILEKSLSDNRKSAIVAKVTSQIITYYNSALASLMSGGDEGKLAEFVENKTFKKWKRYVKFKISYLSSILLLYQGQQAEEQQKMGERVTLFQAAFDKLEEAKKESKGIMNIQQVNEALTFTSDVVEAKRKAAKNENEFIYHEEVPDISTISAVKGANLVNGIAFSVTDPEIMGEDIFHRIVPMKAHEASSLYSEEKATFLRKIAKKMEEKDIELKTFMSSLNIDPLNFEQSTNIRLPQELVDRCADINGKPNAIPQLVASMSNLAETCADVETMLHEINELLQEEEVREKNYQKTMGGRTSVHFGELNREFIKYQEAHNKAGESNETLRKAMGLHVSNLRTLAQPLSEIQLLVPVCQDNSKDDNFKQLQNLLNKVNEMQTQRAHLYDSIREAAINDDITAQIVAWGDKKLEKLFKKELSKHDKNVNLIEQNLFAQGNILKALTDTYARCAPSLKASVETKHKREHFFSSLIASYDVYEDLLGKSAKGLEFYKKLQGNIQKLLARVRAARDVQDEERQQRLKSTKPIESVIPKNHGPKLKDYMKSGGFNKNDSQYIPTIRPSPLGSETTNTSTCVTSTHSDKMIPSYNNQNYEPSPAYYQYNYSGQVSATGVQPQPPPSYDSLNYTTAFQNQQTGYSNPMFQGQYGGTVNQTANSNPIDYSTNSSDVYLNPSNTFQYSGTTGQNNNSNTNQNSNNSYIYSGDSVNSVTNSIQYPTGNLDNQYQYPLSQQQQQPQPQPQQVSNQIYNYQQLTHQPQHQQTISTYNSEQNQPINQYIQPAASVSPALSISNEVTNPVYNQNTVYDQMNLINSMEKLNVQNPQNPNLQDPNIKLNNYSGFTNPNQPTDNYSTYYPEYSTTSIPYGNYQITANSQYITGYDQSGQIINPTQQQQQQQLQQPQQQQQQQQQPQQQQQQQKQPQQSGIIPTVGIHEQNTIYQQQIYGLQQQQHLPETQQQLPDQQTQSYSSHPGYSFNPITGEYQYASGYQIDSNIHHEQSNYNSQYTSAGGGERDNQNMNTQTSLSEQQQQQQQQQQIQPQSVNYQYSTIINDNNQIQQPSIIKNTNNEGTYFSLPYGFHSQTSTTDNNLTYDQQQQQIQQPILQQQQQQPIQQELTFLPSNFQHNLTNNTEMTTTNLNNYTCNNNINSPSSYNKHPMTYMSSNSDGGTSTTSSANYGESSMSTTPQRDNPPITIPVSSTIQPQLPIIKPRNSNIDLLSGIDFSHNDLPIAALKPEVANKDFDIKSDILESKTILPQPLTPSECNNRVGEFVLSTKSSIGLNYDRKLSADHDNISICSDLSSIDQNFDWESASMKNEEFLTKVNSENDIGNVLLKYKDAFDDPKILKWFHKEIERLEKFMEGLNVKTLNGTTSLDGKWKELQDLLVKDEAKRTTTIAKLFPEKNRSVDCIPYDHSRVLLPTTTDDYINAVYVREIGTGTPQFILAQTPMTNTLEDFWSMIWSQKSKTVVCLHTPTEMLDPFWPQEINTESTYGDFSVTLLQQFDLSHCFERNMKVTLHGSDAILNLSILQIKSWAKNSASQILGVADNIITAHRQQVKEFKQTSSPVIINCLTGAERSGIVTVAITAILATQTKRPVLINVVDVWYRICSQRKCALKDIATLQLSLQLVLSHGHELLNKRGIMTSYQMKTAQTTKAIEKNEKNDPFSDLDPLWKLKQK